MEEKIACYITHITNSRFYDAHETLEKLWRIEENIELKQLLKGLINCAVALELSKRQKGNPEKPLKAFLRANALLDSIEHKEKLQKAFEAAMSAASKSKLI